MNPYAPPQARVDPAQQVGELWRRRALVRMDLSGELPDRCIVCNADAGGYRFSRKLYHSPAAWRIFAVALPFVVAGIGVATQTPILAAVFWPLVLLLMIVHTFVRKKLEIEIGFCVRHRRARVVLHALSIACVAGVLGSLFTWNMSAEIAAALLWTSLAGMLAVVIGQSILGVRAIGLKSVSAEHAWLTGTGKAFRAALPELPP